MKIVDALAKVEADLQQLISEDCNGERTILGKLVDNRRSIVLQTEKRDKLIEETSGSQDLKDEISQLETLSTSPSYAEKKQWAEIEVKIDGYLREL
jgi:capsule polysaccharide export protein KpsE/RkpR